MIPARIINKPWIKRIYLLFEMVTRLIQDKAYLKIMYRIRTGKRLNLTNPHSFNEKLQWLKLHDRKPIYTTMVDKYEAKKYVANIIGNEYIVPTLGVWNHFDEIDFDTMPDQFVLKCTHDSGGLVIVRDKNKLDKNATQIKIEGALKRNFFWKGREWPYKGIKPRIIAEKYLENRDNSQVYDYKIFNFNGEPKIIQVDYDRFVDHKRDLYTCEWEYIKCEYNYPSHKRNCIPKPAALNRMMELAKALSKDQMFIRTDFYCIDDKLYFGELTFYPESGFGWFNPVEMDTKLGAWLVLKDNEAVC